MRSLRWSFAVVSLVAIPALVSAEAVLDGQRVGSLRIGMSVKEAKARMAAVSDRVEANGHGNSLRVVQFRIGSGTASAEIVNQKVWRISVRTTALRTAGGFGVGTRLSELLREPGWEGAFGEGYLFVANKKYCGLSFELDFDPHANPIANPNWTQSGLASLPSSTSVQSVLIRGCSGAA